jgi:hypothetical protein
LPRGHWAHPVWPESWSHWVAEYPLVTAFAISLVLHLVIFGTWRMGKYAGWWNQQATWILKLTKKSKPALSPAEFEKLLAAQQPKEIPMTFVEVDPRSSAVEPPKDAQYYGVQNTRAANPEAALDTLKPKIDGNQDKMMRLADNQKSRAQPLQPAPPPEPADIQPKQDPGNTINDAIKVHTRPKTLAAARQENLSLAGNRTRQEGGTRQRGRVSLDVKATPFGTYDAAFIAAVQQRWYDLLDSTHFTQQAGKVVLEFRLTYDGRITDMRVNENEVGEMLSLLCQRAILDPAPFPRWPSDMWRMVGKNYREVLFTFYYN